MQILVPGTGRPYLEGERIDLSAPLVFTLPAVFTTDECLEMIARSTGEGFEAAPITTPVGFVMLPEVRNNQRVMFDDVALAAQLFERIRGAVPQRLCNRRPVGVNERFRCYRYEVGQRFKPHYDGAFVRSRTEGSELTFMVYLNDDFTGGETAFHDFGVTVRPVTGMGLLFQHAQLHEGCVIRSGVKYVLRSDVMYAA